MQVFLLCFGSVYAFRLVAEPHFEEVEFPVTAVPITTTYVVAQPPPGAYVIPVAHGTVISPTYRAYATPPAGPQGPYFTYSAGPKPAPPQAQFSAAAQG